MNINLPEDIKSNIDFITTNKSKDFTSLNTSFSNELVDFIDSIPQWARGLEIPFGVEATTHYPGALFSAHLCLDAGRDIVFFIASNPERISKTRRAYKNWRNHASKNHTPLLCTLQNPFFKKFRHSADSVEKPNIF